MYTTKLFRYQRLNLKLDNLVALLLLLLFKMLYKLSFQSNSSHLILVLKFSLLLMGKKMYFIFMLLISMKKYNKI